MLKAHQIVTIYEDPITQKKPEGQAKLLKRLDPDMGRVDGGTLEWWEVAFLDDPTTPHTRMILVS